MGTLGDDVVLLLA